MKSRTHFIPLWREQTAYFIPLWRALLTRYSNIVFKLEQVSVKKQIQRNA